MNGVELVARPSDGKGYLAHELKPRKLVSIIIPAYNSSGTLKWTLPTIISQDASLIEDILVVDSSDDGTTEALIEKFSSQGIRFINSGTRIMPAIQRNIGARMSRGRLLLFLDSDVLLEKDYVRKIVARYQAGCKAGFGSVELPDFQKRKALALAQYYVQLNEYIPRGEARKKPFFLGCSNFCDRELFEAAGGYPPIRASEDVLYGQNVNERESIWFVPEARVQHIFRESWKGFLANQRMLGKYVALYRKGEKRRWFYNPIASIPLFPAFFVFKILRILPRIAAAGSVHVAQFLLVSPLFNLGIAYWCIGFIEGTREEQEASRVANAPRMSTHNAPCDGVFDTDH